MADGETANDRRRILTMDDGRWTMDDGRWRTTITTTQQSNSAWAWETEEEDGGRDERQRIPQLIRRDYDWGGRRRACTCRANQKGETSSYYD